MAVLLTLVQLACLILGLGIFIISGNGCCAIMWLVGSVMVGCIKLVAAEIINEIKKG